jgi:uncharacterized protein (DUF2062 family)
MKIYFRSLLNNVWKLMKQGYYRFIRIEGDPRNIALGFGLGLFVGMTPTMGIQMPIAVFLAMPLRLNKISSAAGVWITNPVSAPIIYPINYLVGVKLFNIDISTEQFMDISLKSFKCLLFETPDIFLAAMLGGIVLGVPIAIGGYFFALSTVKRYQARKKKALNPCC